MSITNAFNKRTLEETTGEGPDKRQRIGTQATSTTTSLDVQNQEFISVINANFEKLKQSMIDLSEQVKIGFGEMGKRFDSLESRVAKLEPKSSIPAKTVPVGRTPSNPFGPSVGITRATLIPGNGVTLTSPTTSTSSAANRFTASPNQSIPAPSGSNSSILARPTFTLGNPPSSASSVGAPNRVRNPSPQSLQVAKEVIGGAEYLFGKKNYSLAISEYNKVKNYDFKQTHLAECCYMHAKSLMEEQKYFDAIQHLQRITPAITADKKLNETATVQLGSCYFRLGNFAIALGFFKRLSTSDLSDEARHLVENSKKSCEAQIQKAAEKLASTPSNSQATNNNSISTANVNETPIDLTVFSSLTQPSIDVDSLLEYESLSALIPDQVPIKVEAMVATEIDAAEQLYNQGMYELAIEEYLKAKNVDFQKTHFADCYDQMARRFMRENRFSEAFQEFTKVTPEITGERKYNAAQISIGACYFQLQQYEKALDQFKKCLDDVRNCSLAGIYKTIITKELKKAVGACEERIKLAAESASTVSSSQGNNNKR